MLVDVSVRFMWQVIKQYNGYCGCGYCKEIGEYFDFGFGKGNRRRMCYVYLFNKIFVIIIGYVGKRNYEEVK